MLDNVFVNPEACKAFLQTGTWARFPGTWAFFVSNGEVPGRLMPQTASCYSCHQDHGAVDTTFVQFYPTLLKVAKAKGTVQKR